MTNENDFSFMKAGFNLVEENLENEEVKKNIATMVILFSKYALKSAALYVSHSKRTIVSTEDIKRGMMLQAFIFENTPNLLEDLTEIKEEIFGNTPSLTDMADDIIATVETIVEDVVLAEGAEDEYPEEEYSESECECVLCKNFNTIKAKWEHWEPEDPVKKILQIHISNMP